MALFKSTVCPEYLENYSSVIHMLSCLPLFCFYVADIIQIGMIMYRIAHLFFVIYIILNSKPAHQLHMVKTVLA